MVILKVLDSIEKLEAKMADLYKWFGTIFKQDAEAAALFDRLNLDETAHVNLVKYYRRMVSKNMKLFGDISLDIESLKATLARVESIRSGPLPSLEEAVKTAIDIEINAGELHAVAAIKSAASGITPLLRSLGAFDSKHYGVIEEFAAIRRFPFVSKPGPIPVTQASLSASDQKTGEKLPEILPEILERIDYYYKWYKTMDYYKVLGVKYYATSGQIKHAFHTLAHEFHPDRYPHKEIQRKLHEIFSYMTVAYSTLMNPDKKREYDQTLNTRMRNV
jgi:hypothetical protein